MNRIRGTRQAGGRWPILLLLLPLLAGAGPDAVSVDWRIEIDRAWEAVGAGRAVQGNLDPVALLAGREVALRKTSEILRRVGGRPGHVFNLGHGVLPGTDPAVIRAVADHVHAYGQSPGEIPDEPGSAGGTGAAAPAGPTSEPSPTRRETR